MKLRQISSFDELQNELKETDRLFLLLYKSDSDQSECALNNLKYTKSALDIRLVTADVRSARDIHGNYHIDSVPALLQFDQGKLGKVFKGCHEPDFFKSLFENSLHSVNKTAEEVKAKKVIVYTTPTCPHCTTAKNYLKGLNIPFRDVNVAQDQKMAEAMVKKSGQQGVPQIEINGRIVVGFNQPKIDELLEIK